MENQKLTAEQEKANKLLANAKTPEEKTAAEKAVETANENAAKAAQEEADKKANAANAAFEKSNKVPILKKTKDNYVPQAGTEDSYHARIEITSFSPNKGKRQSKPQVQIFSPKGWAVFERNSVNLGYTVDVLHDPTGKYEVAGVERAEKEAAEKAKKEKK